MAVLVDCDNVVPETVDHALRVAAQFGRIVVRRGYGNGAMLGRGWNEALLRYAFTPCVQLQAVPGKNTADIALALDALEALFDRRAETFCLVTSDSDFAYLCRKLRERGAAVHVVGEAKTPAALRNASDQFFEWTPPTDPAGMSAATTGDSRAAATGEPPVTKVEPSRPGGKRRPKAVVEAVRLIGAATTDGKVHLGGLGQYLRRVDPDFSPQACGHSGLLDMLRTYDLLTLQQETGGHWTVRLRPVSDDVTPATLAVPPSPRLERPD